MKPKINKFGFEIEAEMSNKLMNDLVDMNYGKIVSDGSLNLCSSSEISKHHCSRMRLDCMEFVSFPMNYDKAGKKQAKEIFQLFSEYFKRKEFHWNKSMGFHIHISSKPRTPVDIWSVEFAKFFAEELEKNFLTVFKTRKDNRYCKVVFDEKEIVDMRLTAFSDERYRFINFVPAWKKHRTIEFRIFPTNRPTTMSKYLEFTFKIINYFLKNSGKFLNKSLEVSVPQNEEPLYSELEDTVSEKKRQVKISRLVNDKKQELNLE